MKIKQQIFFLCLLFLLTSCGFKPQGNISLAPPLHRMYLQAADPYNTVSRHLKQYLAMFHIELAPSKEEAETILILSTDRVSQELVGISSTQQTRQYNIKTTIEFEITDTKGQILVETQTLSEERTMTVQSDQILGGSNEANLLYQQMRQSLAYAIINRISSKEITKII